jgi:hypothetical protein
MDPEALAVALTPALVFAGSALAYYGFTERGDLDPVPDIRHGTRVDEPWGIPQPVRKHVLPGSVVMQLPRDQGLEDKTQEHAVIYDERTSHEVPRR